MREGDKEINSVDPLEAAAGLGQLSEHFDRRHPGEEGGLVLEREEPGWVDDLEEVFVGVVINGALARLVPCARRPGLFLGMEIKVLGLEVGVVILARSDLAVVRRTRQDGNLVMRGSLLEFGGVAVVGAFKCDLKADVEEALLKFDNMVVVGSARDFCLIVARLREEAGDFDGGRHGDDAGVGGEGARCLLGRASFGSSVGLSVGALVGQSLS